MKKRFLFALGIVLTAACLGLSSCGDDDDDEPSNTCTCTEYDSYKGTYTTKEIDPSTFGESNCSDLADKFNSYEDEDIVMSCH